MLMALKLKRKNLGIVLAPQNLLKEQQRLYKKENLIFNIEPLKKLAEQTVVYGLSSVIGRLLNYLLVPLYTRFFTPEDYGVVTELYAYVAFLVILLTYGLETAFFRFSKAEKNTAKAYSTALVSLIVTSCVFVFLAL